MHVAKVAPPEAALGRLLGHDQVETLLQPRVQLSRLAHEGDEGVDGLGPFELELFAEALGGPYRGEALVRRSDRVDEERVHRLRDGENRLLEAVRIASQVELKPILEFLEECHGLDAIGRPGRGCRQTLIASGRRAQAERVADR